MADTRSPHLQGDSSPESDERRPDANLSDGSSAGPSGGSDTTAFAQPAAAPSPRPHTEADDGDGDEYQPL